MKAGDIGPDTDTGVFQPDLDPTTTTNPLNNDTDGDLLLDGQEDLNYNGRIDSGETDPNSYDIDNDDDDLQDWWEITYFGSYTCQECGRNDDYDDDGVTNYFEFRLETNPANSGDYPTPGNYYEYDALGRIKKIIRIKPQ